VKAMAELTRMTRRSSTIAKRILRKFSAPFLTRGTRIALIFVTPCDVRDLGTEELWMRSIVVSGIIDGHRARERRDGHERRFMSARKSRDSEG